MIYEYKCQVCTRTTEAIRKLKDRDDAPECCDQPMQRTIITPPSFIAPVWNLDYKCVATGEHVSSAKQRKRIMEENNLVDAREFPAPDFSALDEERTEFHEIANRPVDVPPELRDAMVREGHSELL